MKRMFIIIILLTFGFYCFSDEFHNYSMEFIKRIPAGENYNQLGIIIESIDKSPLSIFFDQEGYFYISDYKNERLVLNNKNFNFIELIDNSKLIFRSLYFDKKEDLLIGYTHDSIKSYNLKLKKDIFYIRLLDFWNYLKVYGGFETDSILYYNNIIFAYRSDMQIISIINPSMDPKNNKQNFKGPEETRNIINEKLLPGLENLSIDNKDRIFVKGELVTRDFDIFMQYWEERHKELNEKGTKLEITVNPKSFMHGGLHNLGKDNSGNYYWGAGVIVLVFNSNGFLIECFEGTNGGSQTLPAVHPSGDVYFLDYDEKQVYLYRVKNVWDPEGRARWYRESGVKDLEPLKEGSGSDMATVTGDSLRVRKSSSLSSAVVGTLNKHEQVEILERSAAKVTIDGITASWYKIRRPSDGLEGWCFGGYLRLE